MKTGNFIKWQLKKWLPIILVFGIIGASYFWTTTLNLKLTFGYSTGSDNRYIADFNTALGDIYAIGMIMATVMPFFVYSYRYSRVAADSFNAFPAKQNKIRNTKLFLGLGVIAALFTAIYLIGILILLGRYLQTPLQQNITASFIRERYSINFGPYVLSYFVILSFVVLQYFFNCFFVSLGNNFICSFIFMILANVSLIFFVIANESYLLGLIHTEVSNDALLRFGGMVNDGIILNNALSPMIRGHELSSNLDKCFLMMFITLLVRVAGLIGCLVTREVSGEYFGLPGTRNIGTKFVLYVYYSLMMILLAFALNEITTLPFIFVLVIIGCVSCYLVSVIIYKSFKLNKIEWMVFGILAGQMVLSAIIL